MKYFEYSLPLPPVSHRFLPSYASHFILFLALLKKIPKQKKAHKKLKIKKGVCAKYGVCFVFANYFQSWGLPWAMVDIPVENQFFLSQQLSIANNYFKIFIHIFFIPFHCIYRTARCSALLKCV